MNETQTNNNPKIKLQYPITSSLVFKHILKKKIPDSLLKIIELINISLLKYINHEKNNQKRIELKLVYISNLISEILYKKNSNKKHQQHSKLREYVIKSNNFSAKTRKSNYNLTSIENNKSSVNFDYFDDVSSNNYLNFKYKKKIKEEHNKYMIKEMEYLERIAELQSKLNLYEKSLEQLIIENSELNSNKYIDKNIRKNRTNSAKLLSIKDTEKLNYFKDNNLQENNVSQKKKVYKFNPLSISSENNTIKKLKKDLKNTNISIVDAYFNHIKMKKNKTKSKSMRQRFATSLNDLNFKYQVGNGYLRNNFKQLKKDINDQKDNLLRIRTILNEIK